MKLSELKTGERGVIVKVLGHGGFRKRIVEMGFVKGQTVDVLLNAPLQDPVKYKLMGYEVSLRRQEAALIEVVSEAEAGAERAATGAADAPQPLTLEHLPDEVLQEVAQRKHRTINVALVGNPNCGKTSLFNFASGAHGHVGTYSGVTVDASRAHADFEGYRLDLTDLPGTYSLSCYSPEELYVREHLAEQRPDVVINIIDAGNLERNLYLTTQLLDMNLRMVCALNMFDEFERRGDTLDIPTLSTLLGVPMVPTSFKSGRGVDDLFRAVVQVFEDESKVSRHIHINYGHEIEDGISHIQQYLKADSALRARYSTRYLALKLMEGDKEAEKLVPAPREAVLAARDHAAARVLEERKLDAETAIMDAKYGFINGALTEARFQTGTKEDTYRVTHLIDSVLSSKYLGFPIFFLILFVMFQTTFALGQYPMD
ncbi:MAG: FeoA domain-containing protein, partial [Alloprevotella sp.]|nr:FeoA domain-containing protein [Alloprevotella sp.]